MNQKEVVSEIHDDRRTTRLNIHYYGTKLKWYENTNMLIEIVIAITAGGSAISGFWFLKEPIGTLIWGWLTGIAGIAGVMKPFLKIPQQIKLYDQALNGYRALEAELSEIVSQLKKDDSYSRKVEEIHKKANLRKRKLMENSPERTPTEWLRRKYWDKVNEEIPVESLFYPKEPKNGNEAT